MTAAEGGDVGEDGAGHETRLHIFVNEKRFSEGIEPTMTVDAIARLVGLTGETAFVRQVVHGKASDPLQGAVQVHNGDHFVVTRRNVEGGFDEPIFARIEGELAKLGLGGQKVTFVRSPPAVVFHDLPTSSRAPVPSTDVMVLAPAGYPAAMLDGAFLPEGSPLIGRVKGSPQSGIVLEGRNWRLISYHPHNGGGGPPWNPNVHGFHTYIDEILTWLGAVQ
jgi:hypothetical protein